ncbi:hypothetical protein SARC_16175 [Sphaeroforma arctica JP610]|uniref:Uncharacterized protein n=1 Tax=Sphaeroforma arctica JP610 TaxID=667725 RepID=A0A0L0F3V8_9EUKA|nr:hypothetical protein SARC_16175 [Sphaeroforma arctica JP610]KNC71289.1 hypothetical protein SARC_16175 [Sphaeroforma arctica JP610]|eukprot:XP_014145191.1 hypothetical protein SARC_16175 [Sphaeroforma arctica JP610]
MYELTGRPCTSTCCTLQQPSQHMWCGTTDGEAIATAQCSICTANVFHATYVRLSMRPREKHAPHADNYQPPVQEHSKLYPRLNYVKTRDDTYTYTSVPTSIQSVAKNPGQTMTSFGSTDYIRLSGFDTNATSRKT